MSDNAKTFKAAEKALQVILNSPEIKEYFTTVNMRWTFNLERAPWWGGIFERMIQTAKRCLKKTVGKACLTFDELLTSVTEVEMILNSRPLSYLSSEDTEEPLTPSHLLTGHRVLSLPSPTTDDDVYSTSNTTREDLTRRMKHMNKTLDDFWRRWRAEYLMEMREAHRHLKTPRGVAEHIATGDIVIVHDEVHPRGLWKLGKVEGLISGVDGKVRGAVVKVCAGPNRSITIRRPVQRLYPLEVRDSEREGYPSTPSPSNETTTGNEETPEARIQHTTDVEDHSNGESHPTERPPRRQAHLQARQNVKAWIEDMDSD